MSNSAKNVLRVWDRTGILSPPNLVYPFTNVFDRHLYALYCLLRRDPEASATMPRIFTDPGWGLINASVLSTSNCGNPALRLFGFGPVAADGYGIGYIIKDEGISV